MSQDFKNSHEMKGDLEKNGNLMNNNGVEEQQNAIQVKESDSKKGTFKRRLRRVIKTRPHLFIIFVISIIGFCYHFNIALRQYWDYKTTVSFSSEEPKDYKFEYPGITLCFPDAIPFFKLTEKFADYLDAVESIRNESKNRNDVNFWTKPESAKFNKFRLRGKYLHKFFEEKVFTNSSVLELLDDWSHGIHDECLLDSKPLVKNGFKINNCEDMTKTIETINGDFRCFTYFLQFDEKINQTNNDLFTTTIFVSQSNYEQRTNKVVYLSHTLNESQVSHPFETDFRARISIHPSDMIPVPHFYPSIALYQWSRFYDIQFTKTVSHLLEKPYQTNCLKYDKGNKESLQSFDDCFTKCVINKYREMCKCLPRSGFLYRKTLLRDEDKFCRKINKCQFTNYRLQCSQGCQPDCISEQYEFEKFVDIPFYGYSNLTGIQVSRKPALDQVYRHSPAITFIQLVCDFGGLGGLWLGFSVITITTAIISLISKPL
jgi:hypothetical protein